MLLLIVFIGLLLERTKVVGIVEILAGVGGQCGGGSGPTYKLMVFVKARYERRLGIERMMIELIVSRDNIVFLLVLLVNSSSNVA